MKLSEIQAAACPDCPAEVLVGRGQGIAGPVLHVTVVHSQTCPWAARCVPADGATLARSGALLRHVREGDG